MKRQSGFTLLETTVFAAVLAMIATGVLSALPSLMAANHQAHLIRQSNALLRHVLAEIDEVRFENVVLLDGRTIGEDDLKGTALEGLTGFDARLSTVEVSPIVRQIKVDVFHRPKGDADGGHLMARAVTRVAKR